MAQYPLDKTFLVAAWLESLFYGIFFAIFCASLYFNLRLQTSQHGHSKVMFIISIAMFVVATVHLGMNCFRMIEGYINHRLGDIGPVPGPVVYIGDLARWDHIFKDVLYVVQSLLGDIAAIYRCWILWNRDYRVIILPLMMLVNSSVSGFMVCGLYSTFSPTANVFDPRLTKWITVFYSLAVSQNIITTGLMVIRLWQAEKRTAGYRLGMSPLMAVLRILVESATLYVVTVIIALCMYASNFNGQYILLETITPIVGITFNAITIRIALRSSNVTSTRKRTTTTGTHDQNTGSFPLRNITVSVTTEQAKDFTVAEDPYNPKQFDHPGAVPYRPQPFDQTGAVHPYGAPKFNEMYTS